MRFVATAPRPGLNLTKFSQVEKERNRVNYVSLDDISMSLSE